MASVIRAARIDPERMLLSTRAGSTVRALVPEADDAGEPENVAPAWIPPLTATKAAESEETPIDREDREREFRAKLELERAEVLAEARAAGFEEGVREGGATYAGRLDTLGALIASMHGVLENEISGAEDVIVEIAFEAVCKILGETVVRREGAVAIVREILRSMRERERLLLRVAPADFAVLEEHRAQLLAGENIRMIDLIADERVALGGCLVETTGGMLDGRLETQLQRLVETLTSARRAGEPGEGLA